MKALLIISFIILLVCGLVLSFMDKNVSGLSTYTAAFLCILFYNIDKLKKFKALGLEAELKDIIKEADDLIIHLKELIGPVAEIAITSISGQGRFGNCMTNARKYTLIKKINEDLRKCGYEKKDIGLIESRWHFYNIIDLQSEIVNEIQEVTRQKMPNILLLKTNEEKAELSKKIKIDSEAINSLRKNGEWPINHADSIKLGINNLILLDPDDKNELLSILDEKLSDLDYYIKNKEFRRLDVWLSPKK